MEKVKIAVLKRTLFDDLIEEYAVPEFSLCPLHQEGQVYYCENGWQKPENLCDNAWKSMMEYVIALAHGGKNFYNGSWTKNENVAIISCNDGLRPVIFKLEVV